MSKTIEEIAKQYVREKNLGYVDVNRFLKESLFQPTHHLEIIAERYAQSQTQELQEQNSELISMLEKCQSLMRNSIFTPHHNTALAIIELLTKHNLSNKKP